MVYIDIKMAKQTPATNGKPMSRSADHTIRSGGNDIAS